MNPHIRNVMADAASISERAQVTQQQLIPLQSIS